MSSTLPSVSNIVDLQVDAVDRWHRQQIDTPADDSLMRLICQQHEANFRLWHEEDIARSPTASNTEIADVKRRIDRLNQQRNDLIESVDDEIALRIAGQKVSENAPLNTETPGSAIDRLSIMALRLFHYQEQAERPGVDDVFRKEIGQKINLCNLQHADLSNSLQELFDDIQAG